MTCSPPSRKAARDSLRFRAGFAFWIASRSGLFEMSDSEDILVRFCGDEDVLKGQLRWKVKEGLVDAADVVLKQGCVEAVVSSHHEI